MRRDGQRLIETIIAELSEGTTVWTLWAYKSPAGETIFIVRRDDAVYDALAHFRSDSRAYHMARGNMRRYAREGAV